ncbi:predicted protein [Naegleria gruberi]|uniref:Predicted protein n=1 Tax=Naegleria gruberi TaxID=5762 RepID=D2W0A6_NAEGR|nr:uncharacterized protein NAEGRDRAFT_74789 [Naegleria gruberi]EFC37581.1 predicted protein [Naegleria gruberi]|eukprot:XP_002670325.1 predicted protein [Naegleria gruberi strain NEG-M]
MFNDPKKALFVSMLFFMFLEILWVIFRLVLPILSENTFNYLRYFVYLFSPITFSDLIYELVSKHEFNQLIQTNFGLLIGYLFLDLFLYILIAILFDKLTFGQNQSIFEFFKNITQQEQHVNNSELNIKIEKITKTFKKDTSKTNSILNLFKPKTEILTVLNELDLEIKKGEITCLLGKNGCGKSTLFSLIVGLLKPNDGNIYINNLNVNTNIDDIRSKLGICPQDDLIFQNLSVLDHLRIFAIIKTSLNGNGVIRNFKDMDKIIDSILNELEFMDFKYKIASDLSGGQKRKLAFAISIIGNPEILLIDEVSSGMDIQNRQLIWTILQKFRKNGKIIFLTTHQMEEADAISDIIHILKNGKLEVSGSPLYLKNHFGIGYSLDMICRDGGESIRKVEQFISNFISDPTKFEFESSGNECKCTLSNDLLPQFPTLFKQLTEKKDEIGLQSFIVTQSTLEQVFLKLNPDLEAEQ